MSLPLVSSRRVAPLLVESSEESLAASTQPLLPQVNTYPTIPVHPPDDDTSVTVFRSTLVYTFLLGALVMVLIQWCWAVGTVGFHINQANTYYQHKHNTQHQQQQEPSQTSTFHPTVTAALTAPAIHSFSRATSASKPQEEVPPPAAAGSCPVCPRLECPLTEPIICELCPKCPPPPPNPYENWFPSNASSSASSCVRISDLPPSHTPIHHSTSWERFPLTDVSKCDKLGQGTWVKRKDDDRSAHAMLKIDRWNMYGQRGSESTVSHRFIDECGLESFDASNFLKSFSGKTISFLGDSLIRQQFGHLTMLLDEDIIGTSQYYTKNARATDPVREVHLTNGITIKNQWLSGSHGLIRDVFPTIWRSDILVVNIGAFFLSKDEKKFNSTLETFLEWTHKHYMGQIIWREYSAVHFDTHDGEYDTLTKLTTCRPYDSNDKNQHHLMNYRVTSGNDIMRRHGIPILPIFHASLTVPNMEESRPPNDCRHWLQPSHVLQYWNELIYNFIVTTTTTTSTS